MIKGLYVAFSVVLIVMGVASYASAQTQNYVSCKSQCASGFNGCTMSCPGRSSFTATEDPRDQCLSSCQQLHSNCDQNCVGLPLPGSVQGR
jgi:hypothetical protein